MTTEPEIRIHPRHMRQEPLARTASQTFADLWEALRQDEPVRLVSDVAVRDDLVIAGKQLALDLDGHTLVADSLRVESANVTISNGRLELRTDKSSAILLWQADKDTSITLKNVELRVPAASCALHMGGGSACFEGGDVRAHRDGILLEGQRPLVEMHNTQMRAGGCGVIVRTGSVRMIDASVESLEGVGLLMEGGRVQLGFSRISSERNCALVTRIASPLPDATVPMAMDESRRGARPCVEIRGGTDIRSYGSFALDLLGGMVVVDGSSVRSTADTAVRMGASDAGDKARWESTSLHVVHGSSIISWRGHGVLNGDGTIFVSESNISSERGHGVLTESATPGSGLLIVGEGANIASAPEAMLRHYEEGESVSGLVPVSEAAIETAEETAPASETERAPETEPSPENEPNALPASTQDEEPALDEPQQTETKQETATSDSPLLTPDVQSIRSVGIRNVATSLVAGELVPFTARIESRAMSQQMEIAFEQWTDGADIITSSHPRQPQMGRTYLYIVALRAKKGYAFSERFRFRYKGKPAAYHAMVSSDGSMAMVQWGLSVSVR